MDREAIREAIRDIYRNVRNAVPGFRVREAQRDMMAAVMTVLTRPRAGILVVEAPTGTGKSLGYLIPALPIALEAGKKLIVATSTVALQSQLVEKDLPLLERAGGVDFRYALAKGRGRYLCVSRAMRLAAGAQGGQASLEGMDPAGADEDEARRVAGRLLGTFQAGRWDGDRDHLRGPVPDHLWRLMAMEGGGCPGRRCRQHRNCPSVRARKELKDADVIVVNHDLLLSDIKLGGGRLLPPPEESIYVIDEAHAFAERARNHLGVTVSFERLARAVKWARDHREDLGVAMELVVEAIDDDERRETALAQVRGVTEALEARARRATEAIGDFESAACRLAEEGEARALAEDSARDPSGRRQTTLRFAQGVPPPPIRKAAAPLSGTLFSLAAGLSEVREWMTRGQKFIDEEFYTRIMGGLGDSLETLSEAAGLMESYALAKGLLEEEIPTARWLEVVRDAAGEKPFRLRASGYPVDVSDVLRKSLWRRCHGAVLCSATLRALGNWTSFRRQTGLGGPEEGVAYMKLDSPFDFRRKAVLHVPYTSVSPKDAPAHTAYVTEMVRSLAEPDGGTLVLFASRQQMRAVANAVPPELRQSILVQGELPRAELLRVHRRRVEAGERSVIFGLASFAEGVDLPGDLCRHVIIAKLPFAMPEDPLERTTEEYVRACGGNYFRDVALPQASIRLIQAAGRLLRREDDAGRVTLLDRRVVEERYGKALLDALPPFRRQIDEPEAALEPEP